MQRYQNDTTDYFIEYSIEGDTVDIEYIHCDYKLPKIFALMIRNFVDQMKDKNITTIRQLTSIEDWNECLKDNTKWIKKSEIDGICLIECKIDDFIKNLFAGLGIEQ